MARMRQPPKPARRTQQRSRAELVRRLLRLGFELELAQRISRMPVYTPTARELRELERGRAEMARGEYVTLDELFRDLDVPRRNSRSKGSRKQ